MRSSEFLNEADAANPYTGKDPAKEAAWAKLSPQMKANIGGADPTDKFIIQSMASGSSFGRSKGISDANPDGTPKVAAAPAAVPAAAAPAAPAAAPTAPNVAQNAATASQLGDKTPAAPAATPVADAVAASGEPDNVTGVDAAVAANAAQATTPPGKATPVSDPNVVALQKQLIAAGAKITADGRMGPATRAAQKQFGGNVTDANQSSAETARLARANTDAATAVANQSSAETARLAKAGTVPPRPSILTAKAGEQAAWDRQYGNTNSAPPRPGVMSTSSEQAAWDRQYGTPKGAVRESNFEESVSRMRRLSTLLKG